MRHGRARTHRAAVWAIRAGFLALLIAVPLLPEPSTGFWIFPHARNYWSLMVLCGLFGIGLLDQVIRRPLAALDLLVLLALVPAAGYPPYPWCWVLLYPGMIYLGVRMWFIARARPRRRAAAGAIAATAARRTTLLGPAWLVAGIVVLAVVHVSWAVNSETVTDVGYAGVYGAMTIGEGRTLYQAQPRLGKALDGEAHYDTYGPVNYEAYMPFLLVTGVTQKPQKLVSGALYAPFSSLPAAHLAARLTTAFFDLLTAVLLFWLGLQVIGWRAGVTLAFAWLASPMVLYADTFGVNDTIVSAALVATLLAARWPARRGAMAALAVWTKFSPAAILPLLLGHGLPAGGRRERGRQLAVFATGFAAVSLLVFGPLLLHPDPGAFLTRTLGFQASRNTGDSIWTVFDEGFFGRNEIVRDGSVVFHAVLIGAVLVWALRMFNLPRRNDVVGLAAASASILLAVEICQGFYTLDYMLWFVPLVLAVVLLDGRVRTGDVAGDRAAEDAAHPSSVAAAAAEGGLARRSAFIESH